MQLPLNAFKRELHAGRVQFGLWSTLASSYAVEILAGSGFDWLLIDMEHSPTDVASLLSQLQAVAAYPAHPIVRLPSNDMVTTKRVLDVGVQTLLVPHVSTAGEARDAVAFTRYAPAGERGVGGTTRATRFGRVKEYALRAHEEICVLPMVESLEGMKNIEAICAVDGVDGVFIGPGDLSAAMGRPGDSGHPEVLAMIEQGMSRIRRAGKAAGYMSTAEADVRRMVTAGALFCGVGMDAALLAKAADALSAKFKS
jgi:4-hydroxy-2-oxoheptanedioate aldolase